MTPEAPRSEREMQAEVFHVLWQAVWRFRGRVFAALALLIISKLAFVAVPWILKQIIDRLGPISSATVTDGGLPAVTPLLPVFLLLAYALLRFGGTLFSELRDLIFAKVAQQTVSDFTIRSFEHLHRLGPRFHVQRQTGGVIRDVERGTRGIGFLLSVALFTLVPTVIEIVAVLVVLMSSYTLVFAGILAATFVAYIVVTGILMQRRAAHQRNLNELDSGANTRLVDSLLNYETVKAHANERFELQRLGHILKDWVAVGIRNQGVLSAMHVSQSAVIAVGVAAVMLYAGQLVVTGSLTVGDLVMINAYVIQVCLPLNSLAFVIRESKDALINTERLFRLLRQRPEIEEAPEVPALQVTQGEIRFEGVDFGYESGRQVLSGIDFRIPPGGTLAVVGGSGSGKSTLARLLLRFYEPSAGRIYIDGQDIRGVTQRSLRQNIGLVPQDTILFNETIAYNIAYGRPGASLAEVIDAARAAHVHEFIATLPEQYDTRVGERGLKLSGGEKQRIAIARAILKNPPVLIFDEATSALDTRSERAIQEELDRISKGRSTLIIAHRLSTIIDADEILVLEHGRIVERGRHNQLLALNGVYAQMWSLQQQQRELERTEHRLALQPVNLEALAAGVVDGLRPLMDERHINLYTTISAESARVTGDPSSLQRVLWDLCAYAIESSPPGGRIELRVERLGPHARLTIAAESPLAPGEPAMVLPPGGTVATADEAPPDPMRIRSIIEQHHGRYEVYPASGTMGMRHVIELPLRAVTTGAERPVAPVDKSARALAGIRVLVLDDQSEAREVLAAVLESRGANVQTLNSGFTALQMLTELPRAQWPDVLICDIALGEEDGYEVMRRLRALEAQRETPLKERLPAIALTGYTRAEDRMRALLAGFQIHLAKPVEPEELAATVASLASRHGRQRAA